MERTNETNDGLVNNVAAALFEWERITLRQNPALEADHALKIGQWEDQLLETEVALRRARRKLAGIRGFQQEHEAVAHAAAKVGLAATDASPEGAGGTTEALQTEIEHELSTWRNQLAVSKRAHMRALVRHAAVIIDQNFEGAEELDAIYRELVRALHPSLHPNQAREELVEYGLAQLAYERGDVVKLKGLLADVRKHGSAPLERNEEVLRKTLEATQRELAEIKSAFPYCMKDKLHDAAWVARKESELKQRITKEKTALAACVEEQRRLLQVEGVSA